MTDLENNINLKKSGLTLKIKVRRSVDSFYLYHSWLFTGQILSILWYRLYSYNVIVQATFLFYSEFY